MHYGFHKICLSDKIERVHTSFYYELTKSNSCESNELEMINWNRYNTDAVQIVTNCFLCVHAIVLLHCCKYCTIYIPYIINIKKKPLNLIIQQSDSNIRRYSNMMKVYKQTQIIWVDIVI